MHASKKNKKILQKSLEDNENLPNFAARNLRYNSPTHIEKIEQEAQGVRPVNWSTNGKTDMDSDPKKKKNLYNGEFDPGSG